MTEYRLVSEQITAYIRYLCTAERSPGTIENYLRHATAFARWLGDRPVTKELAAGWKEHLLAQGYAPVTVNAMLAAINGLFRFLGWEDCRVKFLKVQR
ncbi:MAG TPA: site-specific integrase, partial [Candidatus Enterenecus stercoripullorum]|nr:site-specific integrase [Candidatus Enterenecus stercoripullorum]